MPGFISGETMFAIAMTEPGTGSDLAGMRTTAALSEDGSHYVLNGAKTFITGGVHADRMIVCARTAPPRPGDRRHGISLLVVDTKSPGYSVGRKLDKIGLRVSDTAELSFAGVRVPATDLLGEENKGFSYLGRNLPRERLSIACWPPARPRPTPPRRSPTGPWRHTTPASSPPPRPPRPSCSARLYADNRVNRIYGGTSEVMKTIIAKDMGL
jgi:alkylation response protein AidB-like acyl-CoA dehydrogenase